MSPAKSSEDVRKQSTATEDATASSKPTAPKAWTTGTNPITQRPSGSTPINGVANGHMKEQGRANTKADQSPDKHAHDRLLFLYANFVGLDTVVTLKNGEQFQGVFSGTTSQNNEARYHLKMVRRLNASSQQTNGASAGAGTLTGEGDDHTMAFDVNDTADLAVQRVSFGNASSRTTNGSSFRTDVEISGNLDVREKVLQKWEPGPEDNSLSLNQDESLGSGSWDQFAANEKLYNVRSDYDEDMYTTAIDKTNPRYRQIAERADRLAREMEREGESRKVVDSGLDEEDKYSGVRRDTPSLGASGPNAYVPPSKRAISSKPTVSGAPFDPAIISSQLARPGSGSDATQAVDKHTEKLEKEKLDSSAPVVSQSVKEAVAKSLAANSSNGPADKMTAPRAPSVAEASASAASKAAVDNGTNIMRNVTDAFKQFSAQEKLRFQQQQRQNQQQRSTHARQEKSVKLNDLKKFSQNFKLHSRVPEDLVPILAKSKEKQESIKAKADQHAREREERRAQGVITPPSASKESAQPAQRAPQTTETPPDAAPQMSSRTRSQQQGRAQNGPAQQTPRGVQGGFNQRNQLPYRQGPNGGIPAPIPIPQPTPQQNDNRVLSPTSATSIKFNANAMEFRPNPAASTFAPTGPSSEAPTSKRPSVVSPPPAAPAATPVTDFLPASAKKSKLAEGSWESTTSDCFSTVKRLHQQNDDEAKRAQYAANGGIPQGYRTLPVWDAPEANQEKSYVDFFARSLNHPPPSPMHASQNGAMPHQHQLPLHLQNGGPGMQQTPPFYRGQSQQMGPQQMDDGRMPSYSSTSSVQPSPRMGQPPMAFNAQAQAQMSGYPYPMGANGMSPGMGMRQLPAGAQYMTPQGAPMGGHMMVQQPSNGPYMAHPGQQQMHVYPSPGPSHVQPHFAVHQGQPGMPGGYAGSPRAHPMSHQGSQQGHAQQPMYMMPGQGAPMMMMPQHGGPMGPMRYGQPGFPGQHPGNAYAMQQRAMSSGGYSQHMTPRQQHAVPHQGPMAPQMHPSASTNGEEGR